MIIFFFCLFTPAYNGDNNGNMCTRIQWTTDVELTYTCTYIQHLRTHTYVQCTYVYYAQPPRSVPIMNLHTYKHTYVCMHICTYIQTYIHIYTHSYLCTYILRYILYINTILKLTHKGIGQYVYVYTYLCSAYFLWNNIIEWKLGNIAGWHNSSEQLVLIAVDLLHPLQGHVDTQIDIRAQSWIDYIATT